MKRLGPLLILILLAACCTPQKPNPQPSPVTPVPAPAPSVSATPVPVKDPIASIVANSQCAKIDWLGRGTVGVGYYEGIARTFARAVCHLDRPDVKLISSPASGDSVHDALTWYAPQFKALGMKNDKAGVDTLRHTYVLMLGLGMRESSGKYCCGRDMSSGFSSADAAEAGIFQTSWGAHRVAPQVLVDMFQQYQKDQNHCLFAIFKQGVGSCSSTDQKNWGNGPGFDWQKLTKTCPAFATEYAAVIVRKSGGSLGEFGPLRHHAAQLKGVCDDMLLNVQHAIENDPILCGER